ncbi:MAG: 3-methylornithine--L-lysine ligase PylC [Desulfobacterales bacterium]|jgi:pyrrolysine biosynthesis protein PylC
MLVAVVGGNLQGVEATYLAKKAGWEVILIDRKSVAPASGLCDRFIRADVTGGKDLSSILGKVDLVIPALENRSALATLDQWTREKGIAVAFDPQAYLISSSKAKSNRLFDQIGVPMPLPWPECGYPVVAKPSFGSGSRKVMIFYDAGSIPPHIIESDGEWVLQEYVQGPSYSLEVVGRPGQYMPLQVTDLAMDSSYDCKRVIAPTDLPEALVSEFERLSVSIAEELKLKGLMDIEVVLHNHTLKVLEIDARLPSQTPTVVYWSTGLNMLEVLAALFLDGMEKSPPDSAPSKGAVYEHIRVSSNSLEVAGEHIMSGVDDLCLCQDFFGADEALTNYRPGRAEWMATLIFAEATRETALEKRHRMISDLQNRFKLNNLTPENLL